MDTILKNYLCEIKKAIIPGLIISLCTVLGYTLHNFGKTFFDLSVLFRGGIVAFVSILFIGGIYLCIDKSAKESKKKTFLFFVKTPKQYGTVMTAVVFLLWMPSYLAVYPGLFVYDIPAQYAQVALNNFNEFQPLLHTLFSAGLVWLGQIISGSINFGVSLSCIAQLLIFSIIIGYWYSIMDKYKTPLYVRIILLFIMTVYPPVVINMLALNKDNFFALFFVSFIIMNYQMVKEEDFFADWKKPCGWVLFAEGALTFRNNALYAFMFFLVIWVWHILKIEKIRKKTIIMIVVTIVIFLIIKFPITKAIASHGIEEREKLSIPCQQIVRVYNNCYDKLSMEEREYIEDLFTDRMALDYYCPYMADVTKCYLNVEKIDKEKKAFWNIYFKLLSENPKEFVDAFLYTNYGMWYMYPNLTLVWDGTPGYAFVDNQYPATTESKLPGLLNFFKLFENSRMVQGGAWYSFAFMPALFFYCCIVALFWGIGKRPSEVVWANLIALILCMTFLLGPTTLVRYNLFLIFLVPINLMFITNEKVQ